MHTCLWSYYTTYQQLGRSNTATYTVHSGSECIIIYNQYQHTVIIISLTMYKFRYYSGKLIKITQPIGIHSQSKHKYRNVLDDSNIQYHDLNSGDALTFKDKYTALLQQELQNSYWCLHDPITTKNY